MTLEPSQPLLVVVLLGLVLYAFRARSLVVDRLMYLALAASGAVVVMNPQVATRVANALGIGRGADLLLYLLVVFSLFNTLSTGSQLARLERKLTAVARAVATAHPLAPQESPRSPGGPDQVA